MQEWLKLWQSDLASEPHVKHHMFLSIKPTTSLPSAILNQLVGKLILCWLKDWHSFLCCLLFQLEDVQSETVVGQGRYITRMGHNVATEWADNKSATVNSLLLYNVTN